MNKIIASALILLAICERVVWDLGPNFELITLVLVLSSIYLPKKYAAFVVFISLVLSDLIIGNSRIFMFTWSGFLLPAFVLPFINLKNKISIVKSIAGTVFGLTTNIFFYLWTNFGVWLTDTWGMYEKNINGLLSAYVNGLPFLKYSLMSTLLLVPATILIIELAKIGYKIYYPHINIKPKNIW